MDNLESLTFGEYEVKKEIGRGNTGIVYLAEDLEKKREVALKVAHLKPGDSEKARGRRNNLFLNEARASQLLKHRNIVEVYAVGEQDRVPYLAMEFVPGGQTLDGYCTPDTLLEIQQVVEIMAKCAAALDFAHRNGVIHRDIKPKNILLTEDHQAKISDFGIAQITGYDAFDTQDQTTPGSPLYMSPEQIKGEPIDGQSDIFGLGMVMYELLTGKHPFIASVIPAISNNITHKAHLPVRKLRTDAPVALEKIVDRALKKHPAGRYKSGLDMAGDLSLVFDHIQLTGEDFSSREHFNTIKDLSFFAAFPESEVWEILNASHWQHFEAGTQIITEGEFGDSFHILVEGEVTVRKSAKDIDVLQPGACFGEIGFVTRKKRMASVIAHTRATVMEIREALIERISIGCQLRFHKAFIDTMAERLLRSMERNSESIP